MVDRDSDQFGNAPDLSAIVYSLRIFPPRTFLIVQRQVADRVSRYLKAELKRADVTYEGLAEKLSKHGIKGETVDSIKAKLKRGTFPATFLLASLAALEMEGIRLEDV